MQVKEVMTSTPLSCAADTNLAAVTKALWNGDCGSIPVTDASGKVLGVISDRDICVAVGTRNVAAADIRAGDAMSREVYSCEASEDVRTALATMKGRRVRRLPVVDAKGKLAGVISLNDIVLAVGQRPKELSADDVVSTLQAICAHRPARVPAAA